MVVTSIKYCSSVLLLVTLLFYSCGKSDLTSQDNQSYKTDSIQVSLLNQSKAEITKYYDSISFRIIDLILVDRVFEQNNDKRPNLKNDPLDEYPKKLENTKSGETIIEISKRLMFFRDSLLSIEADETTILEQFQKNKDLLFKSQFYRDSILKGKVENTLYIDLKHEIESDFNLAKAKISSILDETPNDVTDNNTTSIKKQDKAKVTKSIFDKIFDAISSFLATYLWFLIFLSLSITLNVILTRMNKREEKKYREVISGLRKELKEEKNKNSGTRSVYQDKGTQTLEREKIKEVVTNRYQVLKQDLLRAYDSVCVENIDSELTKLELSTSNRFSEKSFRTEEKVLEELLPEIKQQKTDLDLRLQNCIPKETAKSRIQNQIKEQDFIGSINTELVSREDMRNKIEHFSEATIATLSKTITSQGLEMAIEKLKEDIEDSLQQLMQDRLVCYFPFADTSGRLDVTKKIATQEREAAIKVSLNPNDITKASFTLLYDNDEMMLAGIMTYDVLLLPICDIKSENFNSTGTRIQQIGEDGTMELEGGYWKVKQKLSVKVT
jgi:hypothetical protein